MNSHYQIYTDASYDHMLNIAACGYLVKEKGKAQTIHTVCIHQIFSSSQAEWYAVIFALQHARLTNAQIYIYTDHMGIVSALRGKDSRFVKEQHRSLANEILAWNLVNCNIVRACHVRAHSCNEGEHEQLNCMVDNACKNRLREMRIDHK